MDRLLKYTIHEGKLVTIYTNDGDSLTGRFTDYSTSADNDDRGDYIVIRPSNGNMKYYDIMITADEFESMVVHEENGEHD